MTLFQESIHGLQKQRNKLEGDHSVSSVEFSSTTGHWNHDLWIVSDQMKTFICNTKNEFTKKNQ